MKERNSFEAEISALAGQPEPRWADTEYLVPESEFEVQDLESDMSAGETLYLPIGLSKAIMPKVAVFIPARFAPKAEVDVIVYFHGHIIPACKTEPGPFNKSGIEYYLDTPYFKCLRDRLAATAKSAILVAPTFRTFFGGKGHPGSYSGDLGNAGKFDLLMNEVFTQLIGQGKLATGSKPLNIVLAGHSAGGRPMQSILAATNSLGSIIRECWGFECLYFGIGIWKSWLAKNKDKKFIHFRRRSQFTAQTAGLKKFSNFQDVAGGSAHCTIVDQYWKTALEGSASLSPVTNVSEPEMEFETAGEPDFILSDLLQGKGLSKAAKILQTNGKKKPKTLSIREAPSVYVPEILQSASDLARKNNDTSAAAALDPATWFSQFTRSVMRPDGKKAEFTFLGRTINTGELIHVELAKKLRQIEAKFVADLGKDAKAAGSELLLGGSESMAGSRPVSSTAKYSYHMFGVAVDINYKGNPYIESSKDIDLLNATLANAADLMGEKKLVYAKQKSGTIAERFDVLDQINEKLKGYFALLDNEAMLERHRASSEKWKSKSLSQAKEQIQKDLDWLAGLLNRGKQKEFFKKNGLLNFDRRFVAGMAAGGLDWGGRYGDMMHFDMRTTGVGKYINTAIGIYSKKIKDAYNLLAKNKKTGDYDSSGTAI